MLAPSACVETSRHPDGLHADAEPVALAPSLEHLVVARLPRPGHHVDEESAERRQTGHLNIDPKIPGACALGEVDRRGNFLKI